MGRAIVGFLFGLIVVGVLVGIGVGIYQAGVAQGIVDAGRFPAGAPVPGRRLRLATTASASSGCCSRSCSCS